MFIHLAEYQQQTSSVLCELSSVSWFKLISRCHMKSSYHGQVRLRRCDDAKSWGLANSRVISNTCQPEAVTHI